MESAALAEGGTALARMSTDVVDAAEVILESIKVLSGAPVSFFRVSPVCEFCPEGAKRDEGVPGELIY